MGEKKDLLVVDDESFNLQFIYEVLKDAYNVRLTTSGKLAIESVKIKCPDLIMLDIKMPILGGYEVCKILKSNPGTKKIPILFITGYVSESDEKKGYEAGGIGYLFKPFDSNELISIIKNILN
ncbi:MAG: response regulator [Methylococcales bacterium]|nr:response regulator [Methylococcales bacterium]